MGDFDAGVPTLHTRVESWECDFNGHWNTRYYARSIEAATEVAAALVGHAATGGSRRLTRHMRFHSELRSGDAVEVRSFRTTDESGAPAIAHAVIEGGRIAATALDIGADFGDRLPALAIARPFLARGITTPPLEPWRPETRDDVVELGPVRPSDLAHNGRLTFAESVAKLSTAAQHHATRMGFSHDVTRRTGIGRMLVELRYRAFDVCEPESCVRAASRLLAVQGKSYTVAHLIFSHSGSALALFELCTLAVDMTTRRATDLPDAVKVALQVQLEE